MAASRFDVFYVSFSWKKQYRTNYLCSYGFIHFQDLFDSADYTEQGIIKLKILISPIRHLCTQSLNNLSFNLRNETSKMVLTSLYSVSKKN